MYTNRFFIKQISFIQSNEPDDMFDKHNLSRCCVPACADSEQATVGPGYFPIYPIFS